MSDSPFARVVLARFSDSATIPVIVEDEAYLDIARLRAAVVMVHSTWSGPSVACLAALAGLPATTREPWLYVVNIDAVSPQWVERALGRISHGHGETFWIRDGAVVAEDKSYGLRREQLAAAVRSLLR